MVNKEVKKVRGTYRKSRDENKVNINVSDNQQIINTFNKEVEFDKIKRGLKDLNILSDLDEHILNMLLDSLVLYNKAKIELENNGYLTNTDRSKNENKKSPWYAILIEERANILKLMNELGLTPASRKKILTIELNKETPLEQLIKKMNLFNEGN